ncbi:hypothetical protein L873DRAFT_1799314 [Choiromyces venosus 120613-1]|uniref:Uncharacterized protein n=1 Tax=Choiromyces venosus 120613-1 TaxID=1336337 RepID=A0A3N4K1G4_9PEZI|nr:hypothetical protein L873DRAFT_1799314 [Choiromyces venosus 120613-1]
MLGEKPYNTRKYGTFITSFAVYAQASSTPACPNTSPLPRVLVLHIHGLFGWLGVTRITF